MEPFKSITTISCPLGISNIDTDQLIPSRFMQTPRQEGYRRFLLHDLRRDSQGIINPIFPLNMPKYNEAGILIAGSNFGCGSSREAAVYVLVDSHIRCVVAPSFGDIFASNAAKNGLLTAIVDENDLTELMRDPDVQSGRAIQVCLESQSIITTDKTTKFSILPDRKKRLLNGWSDIDMTLSYQALIQEFQKKDRIFRPWAQIPPTFV